jgi:phospholipase D1/2
MIVDDRLVLMGSANLNDRSMYGDRDSEIAVLISGGDTVITRMAGKPWRATVFAHTFRRNLMEEHLGLAHTCRHFKLSQFRQPAGHDHDHDHLHVERRRSPQALAVEATQRRLHYLPPDVEEQQRRNVGTSSNGARMDNAHAPVCPLRLTGPLQRHREAAQKLNPSTKHSRQPTGTFDGMPLPSEAQLGSSASVLSTFIHSHTSSNAQILDSSLEAVHQRLISTVRPASTDAGTQGDGPAHLPGAGTAEGYQKSKLPEPLKALTSAGKQSPEEGSSTSTSQSQVPPLSDVMATTDRILTSVAVLERGCALDALMDPADERAYRDIWLAAARNNTRIYEAVFPGIIQDSIKTISEWREREQMEAREVTLLEGLVGNLVLWPTSFLSGENLAARTTEKEHLLPTRFFQ